MKKKKIVLETPESDKKMKNKEPKFKEDEDGSFVKKSKKKCKASELQVEEEGKSDTSLEPVDTKEKKKKKKKTKVGEDGGEFEAVAEENIEDPNAISKFQISEAIREKLKSKGISEAETVVVTVAQL